MKKKSIITIVCFLLCFTNFLSISAEGVTYINGEEATPEEVKAYEQQSTLPYIDPYQVEPRWTLVSSIAQGLSFSGNQANCSAVCSGYREDVARIEIEMSLQKRLPDGTYYNVVTWEGTEYSYFYPTEKYYPIYSSGRYRVRVNYSVYDQSENCELLQNKYSDIYDFVYN